VVGVHARQLALTVSVKSPAVFELPSTHTTHVPAGRAFAVKVAVPPALEANPHERSLPAQVVRSETTGRKVEVVVDAETATFAGAARVKVYATSRPLPPLPPQLAVTSLKKLVVEPDTVAESGAPVRVRGIGPRAQVSPGAGLVRAAASVYAPLVPLRPSTHTVHVPAGKLPDESDAVPPAVEKAQLRSVPEQPARTYTAG